MEETLVTNVALVTGASGGIGKAVCERLARDGYQVVATDLSEAAAVALAARLPGEGHVGYVLDVADDNGIASLLKKVEEQHGPIRTLVAAAGILLLDDDGQRRPITQISNDEWLKTQEVNSSGTFFLLRAFLRLREVQRVDSARFIAFSSVAAQLGGYRSSAAYIASKSAVLGLVKAGAREGADLGVLVNAVAPGLIDAPMLRLSLDPSADNEVKKTIPQGRIGTPEDVAGAVSFLAGPDSAYTTGSVIDVNGGYRMQ